MDTKRKRDTGEKKTPSARQKKKGGNKNCLQFGAKDFQNYNTRRTECNGDRTVIGVGLGERGGEGRGKKCNCSIQKQTDKTIASVLEDLLLSRDSFTGTTTEFLVVAVLLGFGFVVVGGLGVTQGFSEGLAASSHL